MKESKGYSENQGYQSTEQEELETSFCFVKLNRGIKIKNLLTFYFISFCTFIMIGLGLSFVSFILEDPDYYNISSKEIGSKLAPINMWGEAITILQSMYLGPVIDAYGRKIPLVLGFMVGGIATGTLPLFNKLYPWYFILSSLRVMAAFISI